MQSIFPQAASMQIESEASRSTRSCNVVAAIRQRILCLISLCLLAASSAARAESFSLKCEATVYFYISFDIDTGRVVEETLSGSGLKGRIDRSQDDAIHFHVVRSGEPAFGRVLDRRSGQLRTLALPGYPSRGEHTFQCAPTDLRTMLAEYDSL